MIRVALDTQHKYKPVPHEKDRGAFFNGLSESELVEKYFDAISEDRENNLSLNLESEDIILIRNNPALKILSGWYYQRIRWANENNVDLYFAGHLNAGGGKYGLIGILDREEDFELATILSEMFKNSLKISDFRITKLGEKDRGYSCIAGCKCPIFLLEPVFIDNPEHFSQLKDGELCYKIGKVLLKFIRYFRDRKGGMVC